ncbi:hypothetical protein TWF569_010291 [Orbilia oligospora]|nr:hypothetical protein TWF569_010291 [Orbilia oligospora]
MAPVECLRYWLHQRPNDAWLLIVDNYDDPDACNIDTLFPTQDVGHILITSRTLKHRLGPRSIEVSAADTNDLKANESTQAQNKSKIWALLIGINHYIDIPEGRKGAYSDLESCVHVIKAVRSFLQSINVQHISTLTSTRLINGTVEEESQLPKYVNVIRGLEHIMERSQPGGLVYIHYCGHGVQRDAGEQNRLSDLGVHISEGLTNIHPWPSEPTGCTFPTACDVDETTGTYPGAVEGEEQGILTYWMLEFLMKSPGVCQPIGPTTYAQSGTNYIEQQIMIQSNLGFQNQTPILLGDAENVFLGPEKETERPVGHIIDREYHENSGNLIITVDLDIGWAHGADVGAIYDVIPLGEPIQADLRIKAQITESLGNKGLQSRATIRYPRVWGTHTFASGYPHAFNTLERVRFGSGVVPQKWDLTPVVSVKISSLRQRLLEQQAQALESEIGKSRRSLLLDSDVVSLPFYNRYGSREFDYEIILN